MIYITGDTHRDFRRIAYFCDTVGTRTEDILIILGDAGINYFGGQKDRDLKKHLSELPVTLFCIHGNHEQRPAALPGYLETDWRGGVVYREKEYPNLLFARDGEVFDLDGRQCLVIGGAYSVDKPYRTENVSWWPDEQPSEDIRRSVEERLKALGNRVDIVLSHTCPLKYEPVEVFLPGIDQSAVDKSTERWLDVLENRLSYDRWYCAHYHTEKAVDKLRFLYRSIVPF